MTQAQQRAIAVQAVRSYLRSMGINPASCTAHDAHQALDDVSRGFPELVASHWYRDASHRQVVLFYADWNRWLEEQRLLSQSGMSLGF